MDVMNPAPLTGVVSAEEPEGERSETGGAGAGTTMATPQARGPRSDPEVPPKAQRRRFGAEYKQRILRLAEGCTEPGEVGALLRREGLYSSHLSVWRAQRDRGERAGLAPKKRGRKPDRDPQSTREIARLRRDNERLCEQLRKAETIIDVQKKLSTLLGIERPSEDDSGRNG